MCAESIVIRGTRILPSTGKARYHNNSSGDCRQ
jgi:hypothetical protein